jgi:hypothetical protein
MHYLHSKNRILDAEQSRAFLRGFQSSVLAQIEHCLELKFPNHYPNDPYPLTDVRDAAKFVLAGTNTLSIGISHSTSHSASVSNTSKSSDTAYIKSEHLSTIFDQFASTIVSAISTSDTALHCNHLNHSIKQSSEVPVVPSFMYDLAPASTSTSEATEVFYDSDFIADCIAAIERKIFALRHGLEYIPLDLAHPEPLSHLDISYSSPASPITPIIPIPAPTLSSSSTVLKPRNSTSTSSSEPITAIPPSSTFILNPLPYSFDSELPKGYLPPQEPNFVGVPKPRKCEKTSKNSLAPTPKSPIISKVISHYIQSPIITVTAEELLSISPKLHTKWIEAITLKHVTSETHIVPSPTLKFNEQIAPNISEIYRNTIRP